MIPIKQPSQVMSGPGFSIKNKTKQAGFAVPHSSLTIGLVGLGLGLGCGWVGVGLGLKFGNKFGSQKTNWVPEKIWTLKFVSAPTF